MKRLRHSTFALPVLVGLGSAIGLFCALLGDGVWDAVAWLGLGVPALLGGWPLLCRGQNKGAPVQRGARLWHRRQ